MAAILATEQQEFQLKTLAELHPVLSNLNEVVVLDIETTGFSLEKFADIIHVYYPLMEKFKDKAAKYTQPQISERKI